ncbi:TetR/AcrR family transcriptional regulator [Streptococcus sp. zg-JUN1979]|uniref:TetR/AcrR family transcriptional regulator n=1 Tax=Streptococcus sp. zg-JUN1979 TaxID=3391450 RepID=UPI0039A528E8
MSTKQQRQTHTKTYIKEALTQLLLTEHFEDISVSKITQTSGINRGTFYLHYLDKYDLMEQLKEETIADMTAIITDTKRTPHQMIKAILDYIYQDFTFFYAISNCHYTNFSETIKHFLEMVIALTPKGHQYVITRYQVPAPYAVEALTASLEGVISLWINQGGKESTQEVTDIILNISQFEHWV